MTKTISHPELTAASRGVADPVGCRVALENYGGIIGWPLLAIGPITLRGGEANWRRTLAAAQPLWLGVAWEAIERLEHERILDREAEIQEKAEKDKMAVIGWTDQKSLEAGYYPAVITGIEETTGSAEYGSKPRLQFQFVVLDSDGEQTDSEIRGWCGMAWGEKAKLFLWAKAILGKRCPGPGQPLDTDRLKNRKVDIQVEVKPGNVPGQLKSAVVALMPFDTVSRKAKEDPDEDDEKGDEPF